MWSWDLLCPDEKDIEELDEMYGPLCWQVYENDHDGFKKLMWYGIMKEFNGKATSTWSKCGREKEKAFTQKQWCKEVTEGKRQFATLSNQGDNATRHASTKMRRYGIPGTTDRFML